jgi:uncharacterized protein
MRSRHRCRCIYLRRRVSIAACLVVLTAAGLGCTRPGLRPVVTIGAAASSGADFSLGGSICRLFNFDPARHHMRCQEVPSFGSAANIVALRNGAIDIGIVQSDILADAVAGRATLTSSGRVSDLRILFSGHDELLTIVAQRELGVVRFAELRGRHISIGVSGSRQRTEIERVMTAVGLEREDFGSVLELGTAAQNRAFCDDKIDAIVYSVSHPSGLIRDVTRICGGVFVEIAGPQIDNMLSERPEYERGTIQGRLYTDDPAEVRTFGVRAAVVATWEMPDDTAYEITKDVFENLDSLRRLHPAFGRLKVAEMIRPAGRVPIHSGAARYYRERGWMSPEIPDDK